MKKTEAEISFHDDDDDDVCKMSHPMWQFSLPLLSCQLNGYRPVGGYCQHGNEPSDSVG
jgi:hypothetical protein